MKIAYLLPVFPVISETFILRQITGIIDLGHEVHIYAWAHSKKQAIHSEFEKFELEKRTYYPIQEIPDSYIQRTMGLLNRTFTSGLWKKPASILGALNFLKYGRYASSLRLLNTAVLFSENGPYDAVHCQFGTIGLTGNILKEIGVTNNKLLTSFRGFDATKFPNSEKPGVYNELFKNGDLFLPVSKSLASRLLDLGCDKEKIVVHHSGIDCRKFNFIERSNSTGAVIRLLTIARLVEKKGIAYAIKAVAQLLAEGYKLEYMVIGDGEARDELEELIKGFSAEAQIKLLGWKPHDEVIQLLQQSDILIAPSVTAKDGDQEGIPNVVKEAMACGLPVVGTIHGGIPELIEEGVSGCLAPERDVDKLSDCLRSLCDHPEKWAEMGRAGRKHVEEEFDITKLSKELEKLYSG